MTPVPCWCVLVFTYRPTYAVHRVPGYRAVRIVLRIDYEYAGTWHAVALDVLPAAAAAAAAAQLIYGSVGGSGGRGVGLDNLLHRH